MTSKTSNIAPEDMSCAGCPIRKRAENKPNSLISRIWRWHTNWCPGWKSYQKALSEANK